MDKRDLFVSAISLNPIQITIEHKMHGPKCISYFATPPEHSLKPKAVSSTTGELEIKHSEKGRYSDFLL